MVSPSWSVARASATCRASQRASGSRAAESLVPGKQGQFGAGPSGAPGPGPRRWNSSPAAPPHDGRPEDLVGPVNQGPGGPEVGGEQQGRQRQGLGPRRRAGPPGGQKQARLGLAPAVNGLLGVPHHHQGAAVALPASRP